MIPWTLSKQLSDFDFPKLLGARIVRIATNHDYQSMGYGSRALKLLGDYFEGKIVDIIEGIEENNSVRVHDHERIDDEENLNEISDVDLLTETIEPKQKLPPLLMKLNERKCERLDYLGVSFGLTNDLLRFWKKSLFLPVYLGQTTNDLTGEHSCIMIKELKRGEDKKSSDSWLFQYFIGNFQLYLEITIFYIFIFEEFRRRLVKLLTYEFRNLQPAVVINMLMQQVYDEKFESKILFLLFYNFLKHSFLSILIDISKNEIGDRFTQNDFKRLENYVNELVGYYDICDLVVEISNFVYLNKLGPNFTLSEVQSVIIFLIIKLKEK